MKTSRIALLIAVFFILSLMAACTSVGPNATEAPGKPANTEKVAETATAVATDPKKELLTPAGSYPIVNEPVTLDLFVKMQPTFVEDYDTNRFTLFLENKMGIDLKFVVAPAESAQEKVNLLMTSGNYPSAFLGSTVPNIEQYGVTEGILVDLTDLIDTQMPNLKARFAQVPLVKGQITSTDGKIYGLPNYSSILHTMYSKKMWVNTKLLGDMNVKAPATTDEFYSICKQYLELNKNGVALTGMDPVDYLTNAFTYYPSGTGEEYGLRLNGDKVETLVTSAEYKEALKYVHKLYKEGLLYESTFTMDANQIKALIASEGEPVLFLRCNWSGDGFIDTSMKELYSHYSPIAPLTGPNGTKYTSYAVPSANFHYVVTNACKYPEVAVRFADYFYIDECFYNAECGEENVDWRYAKEGEVGYTGKPAVAKWITPWGGQAMNKTWAGVGIRFYDELIEIVDHKVDLLDPANMGLFVYSATNDLYVPCYQEQYRSLSVMNFTDAESQEMSTIAVEAANYVKQSKIDFITGATDIDTGWDAYLTALDNIGINKLLPMFQKAYDRQYK